MDSKESYGFQKLILLSSKKKGFFPGGFRLHLEISLGHGGHVHVLTFGLISYISVPKLNF